MNRRRAMSPERARQVKIGGHKNERDFAQLIDGKVHRGTHTDKKDVIDRHDRSHSVKAGGWWQVFLYGRERLRNNTMFQGLGKIAPVMIACLDAYPQNRQDYKADEQAAKLRLQPCMRALLDELNKPNIFPAFLEKSFFDGGNAEYLSMFLGPANAPIEGKCFHIFHKDDVVRKLADEVELRNSKARHSGQMDDQKVTLFSNHLGKNGKNVGEIETRHDSHQHYREMKFRVNARSVFSILTKDPLDKKQVTPQVTTYGKATRIFHL